MLSNREPRWGFVEIIVVYVGIIVIGLVFGMSGDMVKILISMLKMPDTPQSYFYFGFIVQFFSTIFLILLMTIWLHRAKLSDIGINKVRINTYLKYGLGGGLLLLVVIFAFTLPINYLQPKLEPQLYEEMLRTITGKSDFAFLLIIGSILAPFSEELFYRGMIYPVLRKKIGVIPGMIVAGIIFGMVHWDLWRAIPLSVGGIILCYIYEKTDSIFVTTIAHGLWNAIMSGVVYWSVINVI